MCQYKKLNYRRERARQLRMSGWLTDRAMCTTPQNRRYCTTKLYYSQIVSASAKKASDVQMNNTVITAKR